jgi:6-phosphofructokinase 2
MAPRVVTLTLNPAIDMASTVPVAWPTHKVRTFDEHVDPGGGGVNVARVIHALGGDTLAPDVETLALVLAGGVIGHFLDEMLEYAGVPHRCLPIKGRTRVTTTVHEQATGLEFRFVPEGPEVKEPEWRGMLAALEQTEAAWVVASGSLPRGVPEDFYAQAACIAARRGQSFVLDSSGAPLKAALGPAITLLKASRNELEHLVGRALADPHVQEDEAMALVCRGKAGMVALTLGAEGALLATATGVYRMAALPGPVRGAVGAGDAFLGAMTFALASCKTPEQALAWGIAAARVAVSGVGTARVTREQVEALVPAWAR